jgi:hypothetical protein
MAGGRQQQMSDLVRDRAGEHQRARGAEVVRLPLHLSREHVREARALVSANRRPHHDLGTPLEFAGLVRDENDADHGRFRGVHRPGMVPLQLHADVAVKAHDFFLRVLDGAGNPRSTSAARWRVRSREASFNLDHSRGMDRGWRLLELAERAGGRVGW